MDPIVARKAEQKVLNEVFSSEDPEFVLLYGRRRVGKTFLVERFFKKKSCIFFQVCGLQEGTLKTQLRDFAKALGNTFYKGLALAEPSTWMQAFERLSQAINDVPKNTRIVLFFDEFPWMATKRSNILQALDYYWNRYWCKNGFLKLIICGSNVAWMIKHIVHHTGGLHNRYTRVMPLKPFSLLETKSFLESRAIHFSEKQILTLYSVMGGIPYYLKQMDKGLSLSQAINKLCFEKDGLLFSEFETLFQSLFFRPDYYKELVSIIAGYRAGITRAELARKTKLSAQGGVLSDRLNELERAGFIKAFLPLGHQRQGIYYRVIDEYTYFYLTWIVPQKQTLLGQRIGAKGAYQAKSFAEDDRMGYAFLTVCYKHLPQIQRALGLGACERMGTWRYSPRETMKKGVGAQIDLLLEGSDGSLSVCECLYSEKPFVLDKAYYERFMDKVSLYQRVHRISGPVFLIVISAAGLKENAYAQKMDQVISLKNLFQS